MTSQIPRNEPLDAAITLRGVSKHYGAHRAVDEVDLAIGHGELVGLIGHNGAGKSTLFRMMLGLTPPTRGELIVAGAPVGGRAFRAARRHIGYLPENLALYDNLSGTETLRFFAKLKGVAPEACEPMLARVGLAAAAARPVREYSKGMRQRLGFAQALLGTPRVLFLDEPTNGLDPSGIRDFHRILQTLREDGVTIVITSHVLAELQQRADRFAVMAGGRMRAVGSVAALRAQLGLPITLALRLAPGARPAARRRLEARADLPVALVEGASEQDLIVRCAPADKMAVLAALQPVGRLLDLHIQEPSLEDLFMALGSAA